MSRNKTNYELIQSAYELVSEYEIKIKNLSDNGTTKWKAIFNNTEKTILENLSGYGNTTQDAVNDLFSKVPRINEDSNFISLINKNTNHYYIALYNRYGDSIIDTTVFNEDIDDFANTLRNIAAEIGDKNEGK